MSTAWYKSRSTPKLLHECLSAGPIRRRQRQRRIVQVWNTTCIVTNFGKNQTTIVETGNHSPQHNRSRHVLINPANPELSGVSKFPYFPRGGPVPEEYPSKDAHHIMGYVSLKQISKRRDMLSVDFEQSAVPRIYIVRCFPCCYICGFSSHE